MRRISGAGIAAVAVLACAAAAQAQAEWRTYHNAQFGVSFEVPAEPQVSESTTNTAAGPAPTLAGTVDMHDRGALVFTVGDFSKLNGPADPNVVLEGAVKGSVQNAQATLDSEKSITVLGEPARDIVVHTGAFTARERIIYAGHRIYALVGVGPLNVGVPAEYDRFIASFALDR